MEGMLNLAGMERDSVVDGPGLRTTVFVQGCDHHCPGCHNPEAQGIGGYFTPIKTLAEELVQGYDPVRVTFSGGEPMLQARGLIDLINEMKRHSDAKLDIWLYTGFTWSEIEKDAQMLMLAYMCDVVVDGRFVLELRRPDLLFRGSSNQRLIDVKRTREKGTIVEWQA